ncbi:MAG TPA: DNA cytosine methyltransferase [Gemmataceae bacterium]|jgi:hypothetical protein
MGKAYFAKGGRSGWWRRLTFDLPCPTIVTMPNHAGTALCHPTETRALTLRECARVQEFPDDWEFSTKQEAERTMHRKKRYAYRYHVQGTKNPLRHCRRCDHDLTQAESGVTILLYFGNGKSEAGLVRIDSSLDLNGNLLDVDGYVGTGYHSNTLCRHCGEQLYHFSDEEQLLQ